MAFPWGPSVKTQENPYLLRPIYNLGQKPLQSAAQHQRPPKSC